MTQTEYPWTGHQIRKWIGKHRPLIGFSGKQTILKLNMGGMSDEGSANRNRPCGICHNLSVF